MRKPSTRVGALLGVAGSILVILVSYLGNQEAGLPFVPFDIFDWLARVLPGFIVNSGIDLIVTIIRALHLGPTASTAKLAEQSIAISQFLIFGALFGAALAALWRRSPSRPPVFGLLGGLILFLALAWIKSSLGYGPAGQSMDLLWLLVLCLVWGWCLDVSLSPRPVSAPAAGGVSGGAVSRRRFLYQSVAGIAAVLAFLALAAYQRRSAGGYVSAGAPGTPVPPGLGKTNGPAASPGEAVLTARIQPAPETRPEYTPTKNFYRIDINTIAPSVDASTWKLEVTGLVNRPLSLTLNDIRSRPSISQVITLSCISNPVGGDLISTSRWTGVPVKTILSEAGLKTGASFVNMQAADGFYESVSLGEAMDERVLLVYDMDGAPLPAEHGFPLRIYIPNHYGMKQPKWITSMEVVDREGAGYWVDRGWSRTAIVNTTSVIDHLIVPSGNVDPRAKAVPIGGIAYAGARGISKVEVQVDDEPWVQAELRVPPLSPLTWVQWRYDYPYKPGLHTFLVRAYDGKGILQVTQEQDVFPNGATGISSTNVFLPDQPS